MQTYSSILLASLLFTGIGANSPQFGSRSETLHQSDLGYQLLAKESTDQTDCSNGGQTSLPGCGRRDKAGR